MDVDMDIGFFDVQPVKPPCEETASIFQIHGVLSHESLCSLKSDIATIPLDQVASDLCQFEQSSDLFKSYKDNNLPGGLTKFIDLLGSTIKETVEKSLNIQTSQKLTVTISKYTKGDFLLCHDDLISTRAIAFVYYLNELKQEDGGTLRFFTHDDDGQPLNAMRDSLFKARIEPTVNSLVFFRVNQYSHHEVEQVYTDAERLSINGWFHHANPVEDNDVIFINKMSKSEIVKLIMPVEPILALNKIVTKSLLVEEGLKTMKEFLKQSGDSSLVINDVLQKDFFDQCVTELVDTEDLTWDVQGPPNYRHYETLPYEVEGPHISFGERFFYVNNLVDYLLSSYFLKALQVIMGIDYAVFKATDIPPTAMLEVQRWKEGHYSLLCDHNVERELPSVEVTIYFRVNEDIMGKLEHDLDLSGIVVQTVKPPQMTKENMQKLQKIKWRRHCLSHIHDPRRKSKQREKEASYKKITKVVDEKISKLERYRKNSVSDKVNFLIPKDNCMIISYGNQRISKHTSYIKRQFLRDRQTCYYAINLTIFTSE